MRTFMTTGMVVASLLVAGVSSASAQDYYRNYNSYRPASSYDVPYSNYRPTTTTGYKAILPGGCRTNDWERLDGYGRNSHWYDRTPNWSNNGYSRPSQSWSRGYDNRYDRTPFHSNYRGTSSRPYDRDWRSGSYRVNDVFR